MEDVVKNLAALLKVKTIVTLVTITVFAILALREIIPYNDVITILGMVMAFYFGKQESAEKDVSTEDEKAGI